jgi:hypothetical protein
VTALVRLNDAIHAEHLLDAEIERLDGRARKNSAYWYLLQLSRAESLWGQERYDEAEAVCPSSANYVYPHQSLKGANIGISGLGRWYHYLTKTSERLRSSLLIVTGACTLLFGSLLFRLVRVLVLIPHSRLPSIEGWVETDVFPVGRG